jgi:hypothetical protein
VMSALPALPGTVPLKQIPDKTGLISHPLPLSYQLPFIIIQ